jgi:hypothetical protein
MMFLHGSLCLYLQLDVSSSSLPRVGLSRTSKIVKTSRKKLHHGAMFCAAMVRGAGGGRSPQKGGCVRGAGGGRSPQKGGWDTSKAPQVPRGCQTSFSCGSPWCNRYFVGADISACHVRGSCTTVTPWHAARPWRCMGESIWG